MHRGTQSQPLSEWVSTSRAHSSASQSRAAGAGAAEHSPAAEPGAPGRGRCSQAPTSAPHGGSGARPRSRTCCPRRAAQPGAAAPAETPAPLPPRETERGWAARTARGREVTHRASSAQRSPPQPRRLRPPRLKGSKLRAAALGERVLPGRAGPVLPPPPPAAGSGAAQVTAALRHSGGSPGRGAGRTAAYGSGAGAGRGGAPGRGVPAARLIGCAEPGAVGSAGGAGGEEGPSGALLARDCPRTCPRLPSTAAVPEEQTPGGSVTKSPSGAPALPTLSHRPTPASSALFRCTGTLPVREPTAPALLLAGRDHRAAGAPRGVARRGSHRPGSSRRGPRRPLRPPRCPAPVPRPARPTADDGAGLPLRSRRGGRWGSHGGGPGAGEVRDERQRGERSRERAASAGLLRCSGPGSAGLGLLRPDRAAERAPSCAGLSPLSPTSPCCACAVMVRGLELLLPCLPHWTSAACWCRLESRLEGLGWFTPYFKLILLCTR